jgi:enoyl-CoA hydratase/carnithine racemase
MSGGLELALACDLRFCSPNAQFALQDVKWGFHACDGALIRLPWIVGLGNAMELFLSGDRIDADHALRIGLVNRIVPRKKLLAEAMAYAQALARRAPLAQQLGKEVMLRSLGRPFEDGLRFESRSFHDLAFSADLKAGTAAFRRKRPAKFKGR